MTMRLTRWLSVLLLWVAVVAHAEDKPRTVASGTAALLAPDKPETVTVPDWLVKRVKAPMLLFYFSPTCPHCQEAMPAVNRISSRFEVPWFGISTTSATRMEIDSFVAEYEAKFEVVKDDEERGFARAMGALSTPSVYLVAPAHKKHNTATLHAHFTF